MAAGRAFGMQKVVLSSLNFLLVVQKWKTVVIVVAIVVVVVVVTRRNFCY